MNETKIHAPLHPFLPATREEMDALGWDQPDFVYVTGDAYVDHPSFGVAIISRVLEAEGFRVAILAQPDWRSCQPFCQFGRPRLGFLVTSGNIDSMVAHYTAAKKPRSQDYYSPGGQPGLRPDRAVIVYCNRIREAYGDVPIILGGLEASLRRFAHYDYWDNRVRRSILVDARADILTYGMGEAILVRLAKLLDKGVPVRKIRDVPGTVYLLPAGDEPPPAWVGGFSYDDLKQDRALYAKAFGIQYREQDSIRGKVVTERYDDRILVQMPPMRPLERSELDRVYALPYARTWHPMYDKQGGVPALAEVRFSITHNRGCFGACAFCALAFHQGRTVRSRSIASVREEARLLTTLPDFKGYIHDIGGPTANFRYPACEKQLTDGVCAGRRCLTPKPCPNLRADHREYLQVLREVEQLPGVKKVFIRSGIRFDYILADPDPKETFFRKLVRDHVSGQLKVAPEHCSDAVLRRMGKPPADVYERFRQRFFQLTKECGLEQYLVPYLISSHPGSRLEDAIALAETLHRNGYAPEQVQDFYPTPGTASTVMYYTGIDPLTGETVEQVNDPKEKRMQRALLQWNRRENAPLVREALRRCGREDLIGYGKDCLVAPERSEKRAVAGESIRKSSANHGEAKQSSEKSNRGENRRRKNGPLRDHRFESDRKGRKREQENRSKDGRVKTERRFETPAGRNSKKKGKPDSK